MQKIIILTLFFTINVFAQDSIVSEQSKSVMFSNWYVFYPDSTFKHYFKTDDGQLWYGVGIFEDHGRKRVLKFKDPDLNFKWIVRAHYESNFERILIHRKSGFKSKDYYNTSRRKFVYFESQQPKI